MHTFLLTRSQPREGFYLLPRGASRPPVGNVLPLIAIFGLRGEKLPTGGLEPPPGMEVKTLPGLAPTEQKSVHNFC